MGVCNLDSSCTCNSGFEIDPSTGRCRMAVIDGRDGGLGDGGTSLAPMPTARWYLAAAADANGRIYAIGGTNGTNELGLPTVEVYDPASNLWATRATIIARQELAAARGPDGLIYNFGGRSCIGEPWYVQAYDFTSDTWNMRADMITPRVGLAAAVDSQGHIYALGGYNLGGAAILSTVESYDTVTNTWVARASMPTNREFLAAAAGNDGRIYAIGGITGGGINPENLVATVEAYDPASDSWTTRASMPTIRSHLAATAGSDGRIYAFGGYVGYVTPNGDPSNAVEAYDPASDSWTTRASMPTARGGLAAAASTNGLIYVIGGIPSVVEAYDPLTDTWTQ